MKNSSTCFLTFILLFTSILLSAQTAKLQFIHNAPDPSVSVIDIYFNNTLWFDNLSFREATSFEFVQADIPIELGIAPENSEGLQDVIASFPFNLQAGSELVVVATGVLTPENFSEAANTDIEFTLETIEGRSKGKNAPLVDLLVYHGITDLAALHISVDTTLLVNEISYQQFTEDYLPTPNSLLQLEVSLINGDIIGNYTLDLTGTPDNAAIVLASGFLNPETNQGGPAFTFIKVLTDGSVQELGIATSVQANKHLNGVHVFPNPATSHLFIEAEDLSQSPLNISLFDMMGKEVFVQTVRPINGVVKENIDLGRINPALYMLRATNKDRVTSFRIVVQ